MNTMNIKKGDNVQVISGREKGKKGTIERVIAEKNRVVITGVNMRKHHLKPSKSAPRGGLVEIAAPFSRSNVMHICPHCSKLARVQIQIDEKGEKHRVCLHCKGSLDAK